MPYDDYPPIVEAVAATIDISADDDLTAAVYLHGATWVATQFPAAFTGTNVSYEVSTDGANYFDLVDLAGDAVSQAHAASVQYPIDPAVTAGVQYVKVASDGSEGADRLFGIVVRPV